MGIVVIALDYHPTAGKVAEEGYKIATAMHSEVTLIHVITEPTYYAIEYMNDLPQRLAKGSEDLFKDISKEAEHFLKKIAGSFNDEHINTKILEGNTADVILSYSESVHSNLIVLGSHRHHGINKILLPDVAVQLVKRSTIPILTIPVRENKTQDLP